MKAKIRRNEPRLRWNRDILKKARASTTKNIYSVEFTFTRRAISAGSPMDSRHFLASLTFKESEWLTGRFASLMDRGIIRAYRLYEEPPWDLDMCRTGLSLLRKVRIVDGRKMNP